MMFGFQDTFSYIECSECGCLQILNVPTNLSKYYPSDYYSFSGELTRPKGLYGFCEERRMKYAVTNQGLIGRFLYHRTPDDRLRSLSEVYDLTCDSKIIDVGCGNGWLLFNLKQIGFKNLLGLDKFIEKDIQYSGLKIKKGDLNDITGKWDLIMFQHSFEHFSKPAETLQKVSKILNKNGICLINIPTASSYAWKHYRENWVQLDAPRHLYLHTSKSLKTLAEKANLKITKTVYNSGPFQFWGSEQYLRNIPLRSNRSYSRNPSQSIFTAKEINEFKKRANELNKQNLGDSAAFYLSGNN